MAFSALSQTLFSAGFAPRCLFARQSRKPRQRLLSLVTATLLALAGPVASATEPSLPKAIAQALARAQVPASAVTFLVVDASGQRPPRLSHRAGEAMNPASVMKLVTTYAALDVLGPDFLWKTNITMDGRIQSGLLDGNMVVRGGGDPKLVVERLQTLLTQVQTSGVRAIRGDIVLDRSAFNEPEVNAAAFDGEPLRPYNTQPDALLINFKTLVMTFTPDLALGRAQVRTEPPMAGVQVDGSVPLLPSAPCGDWRSDLRASVDSPSRVQFLGGYASACGERVWPSAYAEPASFAARAVEGSWRQLGGLLSGQVRDASASELAMLRSRGTLSGNTSPLRLESPSLPLRDIVQDVNKFSNNVMAQHLLLSLGLHGKLGQTQAGTFEAGRAAAQAWWLKTWPTAAPPMLDNGSGLSRSGRISASSLAAMLQHAAKSPLADALADSLPVVGVDGAMRARAKGATGRAQIKTGSLRDVSAVAGYAQGASGSRYIVVGIVNHPNASAARPALNTLIEWAVQDRK
ncbi:MAG: D-alanyl-D-alanine carboxypeptidase/D-alanyl-D-alanine-endopeptidase [Polaromonas sp.]|nr:D-alanyl-D-alanine carboxypeptidase/D-alanyl-D-alanine-endopeptidase [Polaromonas sp.]